VTVIRVATSMNVVPAHINVTSTPAALTTMDRTRANVISVTVVTVFPVEISMNANWVHTVAMTTRHALITMDITLALVISDSKVKSPKIQSEGVRFC